MLKKSLLTLSVVLVCSSVADDIYKLTYSKENNCTITKNAKEIPLFDPKFENKAPNSSYTCSTIQKENYNDCKILNKKNITAQFFGYGAYEYTNLIIAFQNPSKSVESSIEVKCTKELVNNK